LVTTGAIASGGESYEGSLVMISGCEITGGTWPGEGSDGTLTIDDGSGGCTLFIDKDTDIDGSTEPDSVFDLVGVVTQYDPSWPYLSGHRIAPRSTDDLGPTSGIVTPPLPISAIARAHPNPAASRLFVAFAEDVVGSTKEFRLFDTAGRKLGEAVSGRGARSMEIDFKALCGYELRSGIYFGTVDVQGRQSTFKIVVVR
jgi:hypothetical protein